MTSRRRDHQDRRSALLARALVLAETRAWFAANGFIETDVSALVAVPGGEAHLQAFATDLVRPGGERVRRYLHTSPEFAMKRLIAAGERRIYDLARVFRNGEATDLHVPAFTMLEWYRAEEPYETVMDDAVALLRLAADATGIDAMSWRGRTCDPRATPERLTVAAAFLEHAGIDLVATLGAPPSPSPLAGEGQGRGGVAPSGAAEGSHRSDLRRRPPPPAPSPQGGGGEEGRRGGLTDRDSLAEAARRAGIGFAANDSWSDLFARILVERVEPELGLGRPTLLVEYPLAEAALARPLARDPRLAERFELYVCGVELANGFGELTDPIEQRRRFEAEMDLKDARYGERWPIDEALLAALAEMPETSGVALGFDRLVMLAAGARRVDDVLWTPPAGD